MTEEEKKVRKKERKLLFIKVKNNFIISIICLIIFAIIYSIISKWRNNYVEMDREVKKSLEREERESRTKSLDNEQVDSLVKNDYPELYKELSK